MNDLIKGEWKKLFHWKFLMIFLPALLILNGIILSEQITRDLFEEKQMEVGLQSEEQKISYEEFLQGVLAQADSMQNAALFRGSDFNRKSIEKTKEVYEHLQGIQIDEDYPSGIRYVTDYHLTDVFMLLAVIALLVRLMLQERTDGLLHLLKPTKNGRDKLISAKYLTLITAIFFLTLTFYGTNYIVADSMNLIGSGQSSIQSIEGYIASPFELSVNTYLGLFIFCKWAAMTTASSVFFFLCVCCRNQIYTMLCILIVLAGEVVLWITIKDYSWLSPVRQLNLAALIDTSHYFDDYINFNFFGMPVSSAAAGIFTAVFASFFSFFLSIKIFSTEISVEAEKNKLLRFDMRKKSMTKLSANLFCGECRKLFLMQKGILLLILLLLIQIFTYGESPFFLEKTESHYQKYSQVLQGELSNEKTDWIKTEDERFLELEKELEKQYERYENGEISGTVLNYYESKLTPSVAEVEGFEKAKEQYQYLQKRAADYDDVGYLYQSGWNQLLGEAGKQAEILDFGKLLFILLLALSGFGTLEKSSSVEMIIVPSAKGMKKVNHIKSVLCTGYAMIAAALTFIWRPLQIADYYTLPGFDYNVQSILLFSETKLSISVGTYFTIFCLFKVAIAVLAAQLIFYVSKKCRQESTVLFFGSIVFLVPIAGLWFYYGL